MAEARVLHFWQDFIGRSRQVCSSWVLAHVSSQTVETAEILLDLQQLSDVLEGFEDMRFGRLVPLEDALKDVLDG